LPTISWHFQASAGIGRHERGPSRIRTGDGGFAIRLHNSENAANQGVSEEAAAVVALRVAQLPADPDLASVVEAWPELPEHIRAAVLALIQTAR